MRRYPLFAVDLAFEDVEFIPRHRDRHGANPVLPRALPAHPPAALHPQDPTFSAFPGHSALTRPALSHI
jgi:hypothetical protein